MPHTPEHILLTEDDPYAEALKDYKPSAFSGVLSIRSLF